MTVETAKRLTDAFQDCFGGTAEAEAVNANGRYRFAVVSPKFQGMAHLKRQDEIWEVVDKVLSREEQLDVSLIIAYAPDELAAA